MSTIDPSGVTILIVLMWVQAIIGTVFGVAFLLLRHDATAEQSVPTRS